MGTCEITLVQKRSK
nr:unnamed protein product [Callosobruchus analis]CAI5830944.1 unnamed protein product [Callosobruchus analis]